MLAVLNDASSVCNSFPRERLLMQNLIRISPCSLLINSKYLSVQVYHKVNVMSHCSIDNEDLLVKQSATLEFYMYFSEDFFQ